MQLASQGALCARDPPLLDLLAEWGVNTDVTTPAISKPRGQNGPYPITPALPPPPPPPPSSATESLLALAVASTTVMMNCMMQNGLGIGNQITQDLKQPLSPIPDVHEELDCQEHGIFRTFSLLFFTTFYAVLSHPTLFFQSHSSRKDKYACY